MKTISGGVCAPKGFLAGGVNAGIKSGLIKNDLALIYSKSPCSCAGVVTQNKVRAACVTVTEEHIAKGKVRAIIANSGNANACTGDDGKKNALRMVKLAADSLLIPPEEIAVASTGVIGVPLPIEKIEKNISALKLSLKDNEKGSDAALEAIMTTDTRPKEFAVEIQIDGKPVRIGAITKGSGMIHPNMATMLCFITTDAAILPSALSLSLKQAVKKSFNRLTVDGDTSTNDMAIILANGNAGNIPITENNKVFSEALEYVCIELTKKMARDGEGATKLVTVSVKNAVNEDTACVLAKSIAGSSLVKTACFGADANWGRVLCAMGYSGADFDPNKVCVSFKSNKGEILVCKDGGSVEFSEKKAKEILLEEEIEIAVDLNDGEAEAVVWGCDLTYDYVKINGDYRS